MSLNWLQALPILLWVPPQHFFLLLLILTVMCLLPWVYPGSLLNPAAQLPSFVVWKVPREEPAWALKTGGPGVGKAGKGKAINSYWMKSQSTEKQTQLRCARAALGRYRGKNFGCDLDKGHSGSTKAGANWELSSPSPEWRQGLTLLAWGGWEEGSAGRLIK